MGIFSLASWIYSATATAIFSSLSPSVTNAPTSPCPAPAPVMTKKKNSELCRIKASSLQNKIPALILWDFFFYFIIASILSLALQTGEVSFHTSVYQTAPHRTKEEEEAYEEE